MEAIVYVRWSTEDQTIGDSKKRQMDLAHKLCQAQGWTIGEIIVEAGKSAFHGRHRAAGGKLASIEKRAASGELRGKALIVEAMDRLSRERPEESLSLLNTLTRQGLTIAESSTHLMYTAKAIADNWQTLLIPFIRAGLAHEESLNKSRRVKAAYQTTVQRGHTTKNGLVDMRFAPTWVERINNTYQVNEQRADVIRLIYQRAADGYGLRSISRELNAAGVRWQKGDWNQANLAHLLRSRKALGEHVSREGEVRKLFPAVVSAELWHRAQQGLDQRRSTGGPRRKLVNLLQGFTFCGACGSRMIITQNDKKQPRKARLRCAKNHRAAGCAANASYHYQHLLNGILDNVLAIALPLPARNDTARASLAAAEMEMVDAQLRLDKLVDAFSRTGSEAIERGIQRAEQHIAERKEDLERLRSAVEEQEARRPTAVLATEIAELRGNLDHDEGSRFKVHAALSEMITAAFLHPDTREAHVLVAGVHAFRFDRLGKLIDEAVATSAMLAGAYTDNPLALERYRHRSGELAQL
jgi:DNA invertase Pin-like site-specific DNA recombinase